MEREGKCEINHDADQDRDQIIADATDRDRRASGITNDLIAVAVGIVAYLALAFAFHPVVIGVPVIGS